MLLAVKTEMRTSCLLYRTPARIDTGLRFESKLAWYQVEVLKQVSTLAANKETLSLVFTITKIDQSMHTSVVHIYKQVLFNYFTC